MRKEVLRNSNTGGKGNVCTGKKVIIINPQSEYMQLIEDKTSTTDDIEEYTFEAWSKE